MDDGDPPKPKHKITAVSIVVDDIYRPFYHKSANEISTGIGAAPAAAAAATTHKQQQ